MTEKEKLPEELYGVLADLLNRKSNIAILDSIRGEYGVLNCLFDMEEGASAGELCKRLHVVPGRMADILKRLEEKELITRSRDDSDRRVVKACITEKGRQTSVERRMEIRDEYRGLFSILSEDEVRELIRLLKIVLSYYPYQTDV
ncbi:MAG: MarR family transcriptional regulator [Ruminiclostridium sp.]|nr:MarR family transcriptional regulator [Ruminiclostridium sp.]